MNKRISTYIAIVFCFLMLFASCTGKSVTVEAGVTDAAAISGVEGSEFAEDFDVATLKTVGKHSVSVIVDGKTKKYSVEVVDTTAPVIEVGSIRVYIGDGIAWKKQANVTDNSDGKIDIKVDSASVNTSVAGSYTVTYTVTDESGNSSSKTADVVVATREVTEEMLYAELDRVIAQNIPDHLSVADKIRNVYSYILNNIKYAPTPETGDYVYAAYMALFSSGTGDCFSFFAASKAFFERLGIENIDMKRAADGAPGKHFWNLVNIGTKDAPLWYHYDATPTAFSDGQISVLGCLLTDAQIEAFDAMYIQGYRKYDKTGIPASATETITFIPALESDLPN
jgi:hypothetical protein